METHVDRLKDIIADIEDTQPQHIQKNDNNETFELKEDIHLVTDLSGNIGALFIRALLDRLNVNEHHLAKWHLENKFRQYQILNYYIPNCMAMTMGISELLSSDNGIQKIKELCKNGFFIKACLGDGSGRAKSFDRTAELDDIIKCYPNENTTLEKWILQERLEFISEFRIHTFDRDIIYGLTFHMEGEDPSGRGDAEEFLKLLLEKLPDTILLGTLIGWDIGITNTNKCYVIETNITGFHSEFSAGFQTSGYFGDAYHGPVMCAWINNYFRFKYNVSIGAVEKNLLSTNEFYKEFIFYLSIFKNEHFEILRNKVRGDTVGCILYLGDEINSLLIILLGYFIVQNFAEIYYLIINDKYSLSFTLLFSENRRFKVLFEQSLFTEDDYDLVKQLSPHKQKEIFGYQAAERINEKSYFII